jgi:hypothetical protein
MTGAVLRLEPLSPKGKRHESSAGWPKAMPDQNLKSRTNKIKPADD